MPPRFNKMIELLDQGQPVYNVLAKDVSYEGGKAMAQTWADYIKVDMEHAPFDIRALDQFHAWAGRRGADQERTPHTGRSGGSAGRRRQRRGDQGQRLDVQAGSGRGA